MVVRTVMRVFQLVYKSSSSPPPNLDLRRYADWSLSHCRYCFNVPTFSQ